MIKVYGASDDLIEIEGDLNEEFNSDNGVVAFSNGVLLRVKYDEDGLWVIRVLYKPAGVTVAYVEVTDGYTDVLTIEGPRVEWAVLGKDWVR